jgi:hypothetical protein
MLGRRAHEVENRPFSIERLLKEEPDSAQGDGGRVARVMLDVDDAEEVLAEFFLGDQVGRLVIMFGELADGSGVRLLSPLGEPSELKTLDHFLP